MNSVSNRFRCVGISALLGLSCSPLLLGCSSQSGTGADEAGENTGSIGLALRTSVLTLNSIAYTITGPNAFVKTGSIDETKSEVISAVIGGLPVGSGYTITLSATDAVNPGITCAGSGAFDVIAHATTSIGVRLDCRAPATTGSVLVNGSLNVCPSIDSLSIIPAEVTLGNLISLTASASDKDSGPSPLTYSWSAIASSSQSPNMGLDFPFATGSPNTTFSCLFPGAVAITLTVSDGDCSDAVTNTIMCLPPPSIGGPGFPGASGGSGT